jgi:hypothetical protein
LTTHSTLSELKGFVLSDQDAIIRRLPSDHVCTLINAMSTISQGFIEQRTRQIQITDTYFTTSSECSARGISLIHFNNMDDTYENNVIDHESSILEFIIGFSINAMNYIHKSVKKDTIPNQINCLNDGKSLTLDVIKESISNMEMRRTWMQEGENDAKEFLSTINNTINNTTNNT